MSVVLFVIALIGFLLLADRVDRARRVNQMDALR